MYAMKQGNKLHLQTGDYAKSQMLENQENTSSSKGFSEVSRENEKRVKTCRTARMRVVCNFVAFTTVRHCHPCRPWPSSGVEEKHLRQLR